jgi:hypothetical protein
MKAALSYSSILKKARAEAGFLGFFSSLGFCGGGSLGWGVTTGGLPFGGGFFWSSLWADAATDSPTTIALHISNFFNTFMIFRFPLHRDTHGEERKVRPLLS